MQTIIKTRTTLKLSKRCNYSCKTVHFDMSCKPLRFLFLFFCFWIVIVMAVMESLNMCAAHIIICIAWSWPVRWEYLIKYGQNFTIESCLQYEIFQWSCNFCIKCKEFGRLLIFYVVPFKNFTFHNTPVRMY